MLLDDLLRELVETPETLKWVSGWDLFVLVLEQSRDVGGGNAEKDAGRKLHFFFLLLSSL